MSVVALFGLQKTLPPFLVGLNSLSPDNCIRTFPLSGRISLAFNIVECGTPAGGNFLAFNPAKRLASPFSSNET